MIVKNESPVIQRCLKSVKPYIDYWVIVDTGSTDGTQNKIRDFLSDVPGELHEQAWVNFGHNRNEALKLAKAKGDYVLFIDADEELEGSLKKESLELDVYLGTLRTSREPLQTSQRALLINNHLDWAWHGVIHESLSYTHNPSFELLPNVIISAETQDGHRCQDPQKHFKDAQILEKALIDEPNNTEYVYYLAQSYYNAQMFPLALKNYEKRSKMNGWDQHTFWAKYYVGHLQEMLNLDSELIINSYSEAFRYRPTRAEPVCRLAHYFYNQKKYILGYFLAKFGQTIPIPNDIVYVEDWIYSYGMSAVFANCALELGKYEEALPVFEEISKKKEVPLSIREQAAATVQFLKSK